MNRERFSPAELPMPQSVIQAGFHDRIDQCMNYMDWRVDRAHLANNPDAGGLLVPKGFSFKDYAYFQQFEHVFGYYYETDPDFKAYMDQQFSKYQQLQVDNARAKDNERIITEAERSIRAAIKKIRDTGASEEDLYLLLNEILKEK